MSISHLLDVMVQMIVEQVIKPALSGELAGQAAAAVKQARLAVLSDPDGETPDSRAFDTIPLTISG
jgi:hypothetical protein